MTKVTFKQFQEADSASLELNKAGKAYLQWIVEEYSNFEWRDDDKGLIEALSSSDFGFQDDGCLYLELGNFETKSGAPHTYQLDFEEHFNCEIK